MGLIRMEDTSDRFERFGWKRGRKVQEAKTMEKAMVKKKMIRVKYASKCFDIVILEVVQLLSKTINKTSIVFQNGQNRAQTTIKRKK